MTDARFVLVEIGGHSDRPVLFGPRDLVLDFAEALNMGRRTAAGFRIADGFRVDLIDDDPGGGR